MANVAVIGIQWGDEGKGKIVDWLSARADVVARFQGGHNAGHTLVIDGVTYKLSLLPSGVVRKDKHSVIGNGVVVDPYAFAAEVGRLKDQGVEVTPENLVIAENAPLILSLHRELDGMREAGTHSIGTTKRGIGPAYEDKIGRRAIRAIDLKHPETLPDKIERLLEHHNALRRGANLPEYTVAEVLKELTEIAPKIVPYLGPVWRVLDQARRDGKKILFEGAQAVLLDIDHGTFPYVTSSNTVAGNAAAGCGISPHMINYVLGIAKAYTTRVGDGPFPTELNDATGMHIGDRGKEFGTVTGRRRRCGWFDAVLVRQTALIGGVDGIALTKLDVLDDLDEIKICVGYKLNGKEIDYLPADPVEQAQIEPIFETMEGWKCSSYGARRWADLPAGAIKYVRRVEELVGAPVSLLSTSPEREDTILVEDPFLS